MNFLNRLRNRYNSWRHKQTRETLQDVAKSSEGVEDFMQNLDEDDRIELTDE